MHIFIKNKKLLFNNYNVKCAIGKRGIGFKKREGDQLTPRGKFKIKYILYRKDRIFLQKPNLKKIKIEKNMGWCDDPSVKFYNKLVCFPFKHHAEKLYRQDNIYDVILVLNFNMNPIKKHKGSAIFIHIAKKNYKATEGCIAINKINMKKIIKQINKKTIVFIS